MSKKRNLFAEIAEGFDALVMADIARAKLRTPNRSAAISGISM